MRLAFFLLLVAATPTSAQGTGTLAGQVLESDGVTGIIGANVRVGSTTLGAATDIDGNYRIIGVPVGMYTVTASYAGYASQSVEGIGIEAGTTRQLNFTLDGGVQVICDMYYERPIITADVYEPRVLIGMDLENMPVNR